MKIVKRDGRIVEYDADKIRIAIKKANNDVREEEGASDTEINKIIKYIESLKKKRLLVEDVQDIIEKKLVELNKYELSKAYMLYRYERELIRKANTTDESVLTLIKNSNKEVIEENPNKNASVAATQRDLIAGEVSKDLTKRILLPEKISEAHNEGILYFHDADYFLQPIFNCCLINIEDMLDNGTVMNGKLIETPKSFQVACTVLTQIIASTASSQYGGQSVNIKHLGKYLKKSEEKFRESFNQKYKGKIPKKEIEELVQDRIKEELTAGVQTISYQINTLMTTSGQAPFVTIFMQLDDDPYQEYTAKIIEEMLNQRYEGIKNEKGEFITPTSPRLVFVLDENNSLQGGKYDYLTKLAIKCSSKRLFPSYISAKKMKENFEGNVFSPMGSRSFLSLYKDQNGKYKFEGRFNQGVVSINLPQIAILAQKDEEKFFELLDERLDLCYEALMCRHHALMGTLSNISPIHWQYGAIARLNKNEPIDKYLKNGYSTISLGYIGIYEMTKLMKGTSHTDPIGKQFALKVMKELKNRCDKWKKETGIAFQLYGTPTKFLGYRFARIDKEKFGNIKDITDKGYYTNSFHINEKEEIDEFTKLQIESEFQKLSTGGALSLVKINDKLNLEELIKFIYDNIQYVEFYTENKDNLSGNIDINI